MVAKEKFETERFSKVAGKTHFTIASPKDADKGEYFATLHWEVDDEDGDVAFNLEYTCGTKKHDRGEQEPFAEQIMEWLGRFFKYETAQGHVHARFAYPLESKRSKFPLPLKTPMDGEAEINGIFLRLPTKPKGVTAVRLFRASKEWRIEVVANRRIQFKEYSIYNDVEAFLSVIDTFTEEVKQ